jgi:plasmid segregation protein ParM
MQVISKPHPTAANPDAFIARAIDIGFGYTKFSKGHIQGGSALECDAMPSVAPAVVPAAHGLSSGGALGEQVSVNVLVDGQTYAVGPDALRSAGGQFRRFLDESFFSSPQYLALMRGALYYMDLPQDQSVIDCLVVGLPLNVYLNEELRGRVGSRFVGKHQIPSRGGPSPDRTVTVQTVHVLPQAMGALISQCQAQRGLGRLAGETHLVVDVGFGTLLWMVSEGQSPVASRSGQTMGGVATLLQAIAAQIGVGLKDNPNVMNRLDRALRDEDYELKIGGKTVDVAPYRRKVQGILAEHMAVLTRSLGEFDDIDNIYLCGGGGLHYLPMLQETFRDYRLFCNPDQARFENLRGFQLVAERHAKKRAQSTTEVEA